MTDSASRRRGLVASLAAALVGIVVALSGMLLFPRLNPFPFFPRTFSFGIVAGLVMIGASVVFLRMRPLHPQ